MLRRNERDMIKNVYTSSSKVPVILVRFQWNFSLIDTFLKNTQIPNFMKIRLVGAEFVSCGRTDRQSERHDKLIAAFRNFANAPKNWEAGIMQKEQVRTDYGLWLIMVNCTTKQKKKPSSLEFPLNWCKLDSRVFSLFSISRKFV